MAATRTTELVIIDSLDYSLDVVPDSECNTSVLEIAVKDEKEEPNKSPVSSVKAIESQQTDDEKNSDDNGKTKLKSPLTSPTKRMKKITDEQKSLRKATEEPKISHEDDDEHYRSRDAENHDDTVTVSQDEDSEVSDLEIINSSSETHVKVVAGTITENDKKDVEQAEESATSNIEVSKSVTLIPIVAQALSDVDDDDTDYDTCSSADISQMITVPVVSDQEVKVKEIPQEYTRGVKRRCQFM